MNTTRDMAREVTDWARDNDNVRAVLLTSTRANPHAHVDELSDYDIELHVRALAPFLAGDEWLSHFGEILVRHPYRPAVEEGDTSVVRLVLFKDAPRVDFVITPWQELAAEAAAGELGPSYDIGYRVLLDKDGITRGLPEPSYTAYRTKPPSEEEYAALVNRFWWNITYVAKCLYRDQLFFAKYQLDGGLHHTLLAGMLAWYIGARHEWQTNPGAQGKWLKKLLSPVDWTEVTASFAGGETADNWRAMWALAGLFRRLARDVAQRLGFAYAEALDRDVTGWLREVESLQPA